MVKQIESHKEMAHILGLDDNPFSKKNSWYDPFVNDDNTGWTIPEAHQSTKNRYEKLTTSPALNFQLLPGKNDALPDLKNFSSGTYVGFAAG